MVERFHSEEIESSVQVITADNHPAVLAIQNAAIDIPREKPE